MGRLGEREVEILVVYTDSWEQSILRELLASSIRMMNDSGLGCTVRTSILVPGLDAFVSGGCPTTSILEFTFSALNALIKPS